MDILTDIPTSRLMEELQHRRAIAAAQVAGISRSLGEANNFQLADARLALDVAAAIADEAKLDNPFLLVERCREAHLVDPRALLHWILRWVYKWSFNRIALHVERDHVTVIHSCARVAAQASRFDDLSARVLRRLGKMECDAHPLQPSSSSSSASSLASRVSRLSPPATRNLQLQEQ